MGALTETNPLRARLARAAVLLAGLAVPQFLLFGPSLLGERVLLPLDVLVRTDVYLPARPETAKVVPSDFVLSDQVLQFEYWRQFSAGELRAGRLPVWTPHLFAGAPFAVFPSLSPFHLLYCLNPSPFTLAWLQLAKALLAGVGAYLFFRRVLGVSFWPAVLGAWCSPLAAFYVLWQGYFSTWVAPWLPWVLLATDAAVRRPWGLGPPALACLTGLTVLSGSLDTALQVLLTSGLYALWCLGDEYGRRLLSGRGLGAAAATAAAWALGLLLPAVQLLPLLEYVPTGERMVRRAQGREERPPIGRKALLPIVLPDVNGLLKPASEYVGPSTLLEGPSAAYSGLVALLLLAPLGWCSRRHRSVNAFWASLAVLTLGWNLDVPGVVQVLRLPVLNMLSHNRFVFVTAFAVLATAVTGLEVLWRRPPRRRWWFAVPVVLLAALAGLCAWRLAWPPPIPDLGDPAALSGARLAHWLQVERGVARAYLRGLLLSLAALQGWQLVAWRRPRRGPWLAAAAGLLLAAELLQFGYGLNPQCDPELYFPPLAILEEVRQAPPGRVLGVECLPANVVPLQQLRDIRGYDAVDPLYLMQVLALARDPDPDRDYSASYARTQWYVPRYSFGPDGEVRLPAVLSMLNLRYLIFEGEPPAGVRPFLRAEGYWAAENGEVLPRVFVPRRVVPCPGRDAALARLAAPDFDPRQVAYVDAEGPALDGCRGTAAIVAEEPGRATVAVDVQTPGLVVLGDLWYPGWKAALDGRPVSVLRVDHALCGVEVPAGRCTLEFSYEPAGLRRGLWLTTAGACGVLLWGAGLWWARRRVSSGSHVERGNLPPDAPGPGPGK